MPAGKGIVVAYNFNPIHRDLNRSDFRLLWNAILNWESLRPGESLPVRPEAARGISDALGAKTSDD